MRMVWIILLVAVASGLTGWLGCKYYSMYKLHKDIELNTELQKNNQSTELNDIITNRKIYTFNWIKENV